MALAVLELRQIALTRFAAGALFAAVLGGAWDIWWHEAVGRESFFTPPHLAIQAGVLAAIAAAAYGWHRTGRRAWRSLMLVLLLAPLSAPFDDLWHRMFGVENLTSPLAVWSPPHLMLIAAIGGGFLLLLPFLRASHSVSSQQVFGALAFAGILWLATLLAAPVHARGPYELLGFWGSGIGAGMFVGILLVAQRWLPGIAEATLVTVLFLAPFLIVTGAHRVAPDVLIQPHAHPPTWLTVFAYIIPAVWVDLIRRPPLWLRGALGGLLFSGILYGFSSFFLEPALQYRLTDALVAIMASVAGGAIGGALVARWVRPRLAER